MAICTWKWSSPWAGHDGIGPTYIKPWKLSDLLLHCVAHVQLAVCCTVYSIHYTWRTAGHLRSVLSTTCSWECEWQNVHDWWIWAPTKQCGTAFDHLVIRMVQYWGMHSYFRYIWLCIFVRTTEVWSMGAIRNHMLYRGLRYNESIFNGMDAVSAQTVSNRT